MQFPDGPHKQRLLNLFSAAYFPDRENNFRNSWVEKNGGKQELFDAEFTLVWEKNLYQIYKNKNALPRGYVVHKVIREDKKEAIFKGLTSDDFVATQEAYISFSGENMTEKGTATVLQKKLDPQELIFSVTTDQPGLFVLTDTYFPGWMATVNGEKVDILRTNWAFRGINIPKGTSEIKFIYDSHAVRYGALISLASLAMLGMYSAYLKRKHL
jgi:uncharacterized membrane protein YfhO